MREDISDLSAACHTVMRNQERWEGVMNGVFKDRCCWVCPIYLIYNKHTRLRHLCRKHSQSKVKCRLDEDLPTHQLDHCSFLLYV